MLRHHRKKSVMAEKAFAFVLALAMAVAGPLNAVAKTTHDELNYNVTVNAKRSTITVYPHNNTVINPDIPGDQGGTETFTVTRRIGDQVMIGAGAADAAYIDHLEEQRTDGTTVDPPENIAGFTYTFGPADEQVHVHWKTFKTYFNGNGGTAGEESKTTEYNNPNTMPSASRTNYTFNGWYTAASGGTSVGTNGTQYTQGATEPTYYAQWSCTHPAASNSVTYSSWSNYSGTQHKRTKTVKCGVCGVTLSTTTEYGNHSDGNKDGKCDACGVAFTSGSITLHWIPKTAATYNAAYSNQKDASDHGKKQQTWTYYPASAEPSPGNWSVKKGGGGVSSTWKFVGWVSNKSIQTWKTVGGNPNTTITSKPSMYSTVAAAIGKATTLYAVYKRDTPSGNYWVVSM